MKTHRIDYTTETDGAYEFIDITDRIQQEIDRAGIDRGQATVFSLQDHCPIVVNERESGLLVDIRNAVEHLSEADPRAVIGSQSVVLPVVDGKLRLGKWQRVLLVELEKASSREIVVQIVGE